jgi:hypothetical protein
MLCESVPCVAEKGKSMDATVRNRLAQATNPASPTGSQTGDASLGLTTTGVTTTGIALSGIGAYFITTKKDDRGRAAAAMHWLRQHALQVRQDLCLGRGPTLSEIAAEMRVAQPSRRLFGSTLRKHRHELLDLASPAKLTPERAVRFFVTIRSLLGDANPVG